MKHSYDKEHDILFIRWSDKEYEVSEEVENLVLDKAKDGTIIGVEIFEISKFMKEEKNENP